MLAQQKDYSYEDSADTIVKEMEGKAFFFNPAPSHIGTFSKWLGQQMREGNHRAIRRRAIVAVDVGALSTPANLENIQLIKFGESRHCLET